MTPRWRVALRVGYDLALALAAPRSCIACGAMIAPREAGLVCGTCWSRLPHLPKPWCARCGHPLQPGAVPCPVCALLHPSCTRARSVCWVPHAHSSPLLAALKYQGWWSLADGLADRMIRAGGDLPEGLSRNIYVPVPLAASRRRERGYNQSEHLALALARRTGGAVFDDVLVRFRATESQTQLTPAQRLVNVQDAFVVPAQRRARIRGRPLVLVDDVFTTGATLNACAVALRDGGASDIRYWTFGRARSDADRP